MKRIFARGVLAVMISGLAGTGTAAVIKWDTETGSSSTSRSCTSGVGNGCTFTKGGEVLKATAYATNNNSGSGDFTKATINVYDGGIGVKNANDGNETSSPNHSIDNSGKDDVVVFEFASSGFDPESFMIGWKYGDADVRAWIGGDNLAAGYNFTGVGFSDLTSLGFTLFTFNNVATDTAKNFNTALTGHYLIFAPALYNTGGSDSNYDYFKISQIAAQYAGPPPQQPDNPVSEPGTAALLGIALAGFWANRRRKS
jgi:hypothetical protein